MSDHPHHLLNDFAAQIDAARSDRTLAPPPDFDEERYLLDNPDVAEAVRSGIVPSGFGHFHFYGRHEGRRRPTRLTPEMHRR